MKLELLGEKSFVARSTYDERTIPKTAGFRWNPAQKIWWTDDAKKANLLRQYAPPNVILIIDNILQMKKDAIEASKATSADVMIPAPDGLSYLPFQKAGIVYAQNRQTVLIADEMGLGKTIQAIGIINNDETIKSVLIICPASLKINWMRECSKWFVRKMSIEIANSNGFPQSDVVILNYDLLKKHREALRQRKWDLLICDESHYLKNTKTQRTAEVLGKWNADPNKVLSPIPAERKLYLTGTPIVNRPIEMWPILNSTGNWKSWKYYVTRYCNGKQTRYGWDVSGASNLTELQEKLRSTIMVRRLKKDVLTELPAKRRQVLELPANGAAVVVAQEQEAWKRQEEKMSQLKADVELAKTLSDEEYSKAIENLREGTRIAFTEISKMRHAVALAKIPAVIDHLMESLESEEKVVIFAHHHDVVSALSNSLKEKEIGHSVLTGETSMEDRQKAVDNFQNDPTCCVFIGSIKAAGVGITLTAASHVVFAELDWVPGNISQAEDRVHRIGQSNSVLIQHLVLDGSLDVTMAHTLVEKQAVIDSALDKEPIISDPVIPTVESVTANVSKKKIQEEGKNLNPEKIELIHQGLKVIAGVCDGARNLDGQGYNKLDARIGHSLANASNLTPSQAALGKILCCKYKRQIPEVWTEINDKELN